MILFYVVESGPSNNILSINLLCIISVRIIARNAYICYSAYA